MTLFSFQTALGRLLEQKGEEGEAKAKCKEEQLNLCKAPFKQALGSPLRGPGLLPAKGPWEHLPRSGAAGRMGTRGDFQVGEREGALFYLLWA